MIRPFTKRDSSTDGSQAGASAAAPQATTGSNSSTGAVTSGKGRPTRTRKEAEAEAKLKAKQARVINGSRKQQREYQGERSRTIRQAIKDGDERYLGKRDAGPVRRFVRDYVDRRLCMAELSLPMLMMGLLLSGADPQAGSGILNATILVVAIDSIILHFGLRRELKRRFPEDPMKGHTLYALMRAFQMRFMRIPKRQVKLHQKLPEYYSTPRH